MTLRDVMTTQVRTVSRQNNLRDAATIMREVDTGAVPVMDGAKPVGIVTDRDIVLRSVAEGKDPNELKVSDVMTEGVQTISPDANVDEALAKMKEGQIRRLIVMNNGDFCGIVSLGDLALHVRQDAKKGDTLEGISEPS